MGSQTTDENHKAAGKFFISADGARAPRPSDVAVGALGALVVFVTALKSDQIEWAADTVGQLVALFPSWLLTTFTVVYGVGLIYALIIIVMAVVHFRTRMDLVRAGTMSGCSQNTVQDMKTIRDIGRNRVSR